MRQKHSCEREIISAAGSVDGFPKVSEQSEHNVLTFRTDREKDNNVFDDSKYERTVLCA